MNFYRFIVARKKSGMSQEDLARALNVSFVTINRWKNGKTLEDDGEPFDEKMARLTSELSELFAQSHTLEAEIKERLGAIGYKIKQYGDHHLSIGRRNN